MDILRPHRIHVHLAESAADIIFKNIMINDWLLYVVGYSAVFMLGLRFRHAKTGERIGVIAIMAAAMAVSIYTLQYQLVRLIEKRWPNNPVTKYLVG